MQSEGDSIWPSAVALGGVAALSVAVFAFLMTAVSFVTAAFGAYLFFTMAVITGIDRRHFVIPDVLSLPALGIGLLASAVFAPDGDWFAGLTEGLAGAVIGGGTLLLLRAAYFRFRGIEGLGLGDVKLAAVAGAWLGPATLAPACLAAALAAILGVLLQAALGGGKMINARRPVPFGSFMAPVIFAFWIMQILEICIFGLDFLPMR